MKYLKRILCAMLCVFMVSLCACGKAKDPPEMKNPNETTPNELSLQEVLLAAFNKFDAATKKEVSGTKSFAATNQDGSYLYSQYNEFVYPGMYLLKLLSQAENLKADKVFEDDESELVLSTGKASKLNLLKITRKKQNYLNLIEIYMLFQKKSINFAENPRNFVLIYFNIGYDENTEDLTLTYRKEDSKENEYSAGQNSNSNYYEFVFDSKLNKINATSFARLSEFDYDQTYLIPINVVRYEYLSFNLITNTKETPDVSFDLNKEEVKQSAWQQLVLFEQTKNETLSIQGEKTKAGGLSNLLVKAASATKISEL